MIHHLDNMLRHLFITQVDGLTDETQVGFQPPDETWRNHVSNLDGNALNVYMADLRENRKLRTNERVREMENGIVTETPAPRRIECHYLITAWSPAAETPSVEPTVDEHALLYDVVRVLTTNEPLVPRQVYEPEDPLPVGFPEEIADEELPTALLPVEGFSKLAEFWGTMGVNHRWKPAVYLVVTLPVVFEPDIAGALVTTRITEYRQSGRPQTSEVWIQIAGTVTNLAGDPVSGAWVRLDPVAQKVTTQSDGRFTFLRLRSGDYTLRVRATGFNEVNQPIQVPSPGGGYDVQLV
jgi:Pvc16 N-terminal domain/Carboxypeptidase regulatory-like domain